MKISAILVIVLLSLAGCSQNKHSNASGGSVVLKGDGYAFSIPVSPRWTVDTTDRALLATSKAVLYFDEERERPWGIYVNTATKKLEGEKTLANLLSYNDTTLFKGVRNVVSKTDTLFTKDKKKAILTGYSHGWAAAYVDDVNVVAFFWLMSKDEKHYQSDFDVLKQVVESYSSGTVDQSKKN